VSLRVVQSLRSLSPSCRDAARLISEASERDLGPAERAGLLMHLALCRACRNFRRSVRFLEALLLAAAKTQALSSAENLSPAAKDRISRALRTDLNRFDRPCP